MTVPNTHNYIGTTCRMKINCKYHCSLHVIIDTKVPMYLGLNRNGLVTLSKTFFFILIHKCIHRLPTMASNNILFEFFRTIFVIHGKRCRHIFSLSSVKLFDKNIIIKQISSGKNNYNKTNLILINFLQ